jgi:peptidoglycan/xylan/chitin deacetylase (PgdA/CDA1 family)
MDPADPAPLGGHVFLTFDDGPNPATTPQALDVLRSYGVPATFLMLGENATDPAAAAIVDDILADPLFDIGNHTWDHQDLADLDLADAEAEMDDTTDALAGLGVTPTFFRFPYGDSTCATHDAATSRGYRVLGWHIDTADWCYAAGDGVCTTADYWRVPEEYESDMVGLSMEQIRRFDGGIVLFHDIHAWTVDQLPAFIDAVLAEGFTFAAVDDASLLPNLNAGTPADLPWLGEPCSVSDDRCWEVEHAAWCEAVADGSDEGVCTLSCEGYCLDRDGAATTFCADAGGAGQCIGRADPLNDDCAAVPGTVKRDLDRFVGASGAPDATVSVCAPSTW